MKSPFSVLFVTLLLVLSACGKKSSSDDSSSEKKTTATGLALSEASPKESFDLVTTAVESFDEAIEAAAGSLAIELLDGEGEGDGEDRENLSKWCSWAAEPLEEADTSFSSLRLTDNRLNSSDPKYAARLFHCKMKVDTGSPESIRGIIAMPKGIACALEAGGLLDFDNPGTAEGGFDIDSSCFSEGFINQMEEEFGVLEGNATITTSVLSGVEGGWQKRIKLTDIDIDETTEIEISLFNSSDKMAMMVKQTNTENPDDETVSSFSLTQTGELRVETKTYRYTSSNEDNRFNLGMRILAKGELAVKDKANSLNAVFTDFYSYEGIFMSLSRSEETTSGQLATIRGTVDEGFLTRTYLCNQDGQTSCEAGDISTFIEGNSGESVCVPSDKECSGLEAIEYEDASFLMITETSIDDLENSPHAWGKKLTKPLDYETVNSDFAQYPK